MNQKRMRGMNPPFIETPESAFLVFLVQVFMALCLFFANFFARNDGSVAAKKFYRQLLLWGRVSGLSHVVSETPREYGLRLGNHFPSIEEEIRQIIHVHNDAIYGYIPPDRRQISRARQALRKLSHPRLWIARIKSLCWYDRI